MPVQQEQSWWGRQRRGTRRTLVIAGTVLLVAGYLWLWGWGVPLLYSHSGHTADARLKAITDTRTALLAGLVGVGALGTFWLNGRTLRVTQETFRVAERSHVTDRYSKAIEQLGSPTLDVRLGGIYALEQIAKDSLRREEDQVTIVEVLSAFVRVHSDPVYRLRNHLVLLGLKMLEEYDQEQAAAEQHVIDYPLPDDVQAAVNVLSRLTPLKKVHADLRKAWLAGIDLGWQDAKLPGALLGRANLAGAKLVGADLTEADLHQAILKPSIKAGLRTPARLANVKLDSAWLVGADLTEADLQGAVLTKAYLASAYNDGVWDSKEGHLAKDPIEANLTNTKLHGADLTSARLTQKQLHAALGDYRTKLPQGYNRPDTWENRGAGPD